MLSEAGTAVFLFGSDLLDDAFKGVSRWTQEFCGYARPGVRTESLLSYLDFTRMLILVSLFGLVYIFGIIL